MALAIDTIDGQGLSNEARCELLPKKSKVTLYFHSKSRLTSCTLLTRQSASVLKVGVPCSLQILYQKTGLYCYSKNFGIKQLYTTLKSFVTKVLEYKDRSKFVCVAMCSLVMSLCSRDLLVTSLRTITIH